MDRSQFLQVMRFIAAGLVLCTHVTFYFHERLSASVAIWHFGEVGVPIFFVISGIVMVVSTKSLPLDADGARAFMLRRIIRIVPLWWVALLVKTVVALARPDVVNHNHFQLDYAVKSFLFIPYFNELHAVVPLHGVGWTLLHEIYFYLLFSAAMLCRLRPAVAASVVIVLLWAAGRLFQVDNPAWAVATSTANLQFVVGMAVGTVFTESRAGSHRSWALVLAAGAGLLGLLPERFGVHYAYPAVLAVGAATLWLSNVRLPRALATIGKLGDSSYSLYLFHPFIAPATLLALGKLFPGLSIPMHISAAIVLTIAVAHALHLLVEVPVVHFARNAILGRAEGSGNSVRATH